MYTLLPDTLFVEDRLFQEAPFVMKLHNNASNETQYTGYTIDVLKKIAEMNNFNYDIREPADGLVGTAESDGEWSGMIGELQRGVSIWDVKGGFTIKASKGPTSLNQSDRVVTCHDIKCHHVKLKDIS